jgi:hypothetical protein
VFVLCCPLTAEINILTEYVIPGDADIVVCMYFDCAVTPVAIVVTPATEVPS